MPVAVQWPSLLVCRRGPMVIGETESEELPATRPSSSPAGEEVPGTARGTDLTFREREVPSATFEDRFNREIGRRSSSFRP